MYFYVSIGNGKPREPALCQLYRHTFVPYWECLRPVWRWRRRRNESKQNRQWRRFLLNGGGVGERSPQRGPGAEPLVRRSEGHSLLKLKRNWILIIQNPFNSDWTHIESVGGCYKLLPRRLQWPVAGLGCRSLHEHAHLLVINSAQEQAAVAGFLASNSGRCTFIPGSPTQASQLTLHVLFLAHDSRLYKTAQTAKSDIISSSQYPVQTP